MKRYLPLLAASIAALAVVLPATAGATTFRGAVIAKDSARKALVTASRDGTVRTVRLHTNFNRFRVGSTVAVRGVKLPDGTFSAAAVRRLGKARGTQVRGTIVRQLTARLVMSAGGSVFALRLAGKQSAAEGGLKPGDKVECNVRFKGSSPETRRDRVDKIGHDGQLVLEGIYLSTDEEGTIELAVIRKGRVFVNVPENIEVPEFHAGDEVALVVTVEADGSFTLVKGESENEPGEGDDDGNVDIGKEQFSVPGVLSAIGVDGLSVKVQGRVEAVRCTFKTGSVDLSGYEVGQWVYVTCKYAEGRFVLVAIKHKDAPPPGDSPLGVQGTIVSLDSGEVGVEVEGSDDPVSCDVPAGMDLLGFAEGELVKMYCVKNGDGGYTLKALISDHASVSPEGSWFIVNGTILEVNSAQVSVEVEGHPSPVTCAVVAGADLSAFHVDDQVTMKCKLIGEGFKLKLLESATAHYELNG
jgi:hypothetical protein